MSLAQQYDTLQQPGRSNLRDLHHALDGAVSEAYSFTEDEDLSPSSLRVNKDLAADPETHAALACRWRSLLLRQPNGRCRARLWRLTLECDIATGSAAPRAAGRAFGITTTPGKRGGAFTAVVAIFGLMLGAVADFAGAFGVLGWVGIVGVGILAAAAYRIHLLSSNADATSLWHPRLPGERRRAVALISILIVGGLLVRVPATTGRSAKSFAQVKGGVTRCIPGSPAVSSDNAAGQRGGV